MAKPFQISLAKGCQAKAVEVNSFEDLPSALQAIELLWQRPVLVLVGGASGISDSDLVRLRQIFLEVIAPQVESLGAAVVDGGTDAGVMQLMGKARAQIGGTFPLIGVVARGTAIVPSADNTGTREDAAELEPNHTHFAIVPGNEWGAESPWIARAATILANGSPSATIVVNGGEIAWQDASQSVQSGRPIIAVAGSGRTADQIAAALQGTVTDERAREILAFGQVQAVDLMAGLHPFTEIIKDVLSEPQKLSTKEKKWPKKTHIRNS